MRTHNKKIDVPKLGSGDPGKSCFVRLHSSAWGSPLKACGDDVRVGSRMTFALGDGMAYGNGNECNIHEKFALSKLH